MTDLYNAGLEERIGAYRRQRKSIRYFDQCKQITDLRREFPDLAAVDVRILRSPLNRLNKAFGGFFSRIKNGQAPGFPRFRARRRYRSFEVDQDPGPMLKFSENGKARVRIKGLPVIGFKPNRELPPIEDLKVLRVVRTPKRVEVHLVYRIEIPEPVRAEDAKNPIGIDLGVNSPRRPVRRDPGAGTETGPEEDPEGPAETCQNQARLERAAEAPRDARPGLAGRAGAGLRLSA